MQVKLTKGEPVMVRMAGTSDEWTPAVVELVSDNGVSVALSLDGVVRASGGFVGVVLPLLIEQQITGLDGTEYEIEINAANAETFKEPGNGNAPNVH